MHRLLLSGCNGLSLEFCWHGKIIASLLARSRPFCRRLLTSICGILVDLTTVWTHIDCSALWSLCVSRAHLILSSMLIWSGLRSHWLISSDWAHLYSRSCLSGTCKQLISLLISLQMLITADWWHIWSLLSSLRLISLTLIRFDLTFCHSHWLYCLLNLWPSWIYHDKWPRCSRSHKSWLSW